MRTLVLTLAALGIITAGAILVFGVEPSGDGLTATTWRWTGTTATGPGGPSAVPDPSSYTIEFRPDRTFEAKADCNVVSGTYRRIPPGRTGPMTRLTITPGPGSLVACGTGSLSEVYVQGLETAWSYAIANGQLTITLTDGSSMTFR